MMCFRLSPAILAGMMIVGVAAEAQSQSQNSSELVLRSTTRIVSIDAVVLDREGHPVTDLKKDDFTVLEDGKPQSVAAFSVSSGGSADTRRAAPPLLPPHVTTNRPEVIEREQNLSVLLLDGLNTTAQNQVFLKQQMLKFLAEQYDPRRKLAVFALTEKLMVLQDFTSDPRLLKLALQKYVANTPAVARAGGEWDLSTTYASTPGISLPPQANGGPDASGVDPTAAATSGGSADTIANDIAYMMRRFEKESENFARDRRVAITLDALQQIARYLSGQRGRKSLLWFSSGFPIVVTGPNPEDMETYRAYGDQLRTVTNLLNDAHVAIYSIDAAGLVGESLSDVSRSGRDATGRIALTVEANKNQSKEDFARMATNDTLERAADETGGRFFHANDIANAISVSLEDSSNYYLLGYYPTNKKWDGKFRQLKVKVNRPGVTVRARQGYYALDSSPSRRDKDKDSLRMAVGSNILPSTQVTFMARAIPPARNADLTVEFAVDSSTVSFETTAFSEGNATPVARQNCNLSFEVQAFSPEGKLVKAEVQSANADLAPETYDRVRKQGIPMKVPITLPPGRYLLHLGVRDNHTGLLGTARLAVEVGQK